MHRRGSAAVLPPTLQAPGLFRPQVDCAAAGRLMSTSKPRTMDDDPIGEVADQNSVKGSSSRRLLLRKSRTCAAPRHACMAVVNGGRDDRRCARLLGSTGGCGGWRRSSNCSEANSCPSLPRARSRIKIPDRAFRFQAPQARLIVGRRVHLRCICGDSVSMFVSRSLSASLGSFLPIPDRCLVIVDDPPAMAAEAQVLRSQVYARSSVPWLTPGLEFATPAGCTIFENAPGF